MDRASSWTVQRGLVVRMALLLSGATTALAATNSPTISHPWMRFLTRSTPAAGYFTLTNNTGHVITLSGATSPDCGELMLHESVVQNGTAEMKMVPGIAVPNHRSVTFSPGAYHLMCMSPTAAIAPGRNVPVTLQFKDDSSLRTTFPVYGAKGK